jgi:uncharacterized membrane protein
MSVSKKTSRWIEAGLLSETQAQNIIAFEKKRGAGRLMKGLYGLGGFAVLIGVLAIIASNWQIIPPYTKLALHLLINSVLAYGIYIFERRGKTLARELSVFGLTGLTLTLIALTGQIFHLNGSIAAALVLWMGLCTPFALVYGRTYISLIPWLIGFVGAIFAGIGEYILPQLNDTDAVVVVVGVCALLPLAFIQAAGSFQNINRPALRKLLFCTGLAGSFIAANTACQIWYDGGLVDSLTAQFMIAGVLAMAAAGVFLIRLPAVRDVAQSPDNTRLFLWGGLAVSALPFIFPEVESGLLAAATFIAYWIFLGFMGQRTGRQSLVSISIAVIAIRIYVIYLELFGSMLQTGVGLVFSGLLLMGMVWGARRINKNMGMINLEGDDHE